MILGLRTEKEEGATKTLVILEHAVVDDFWIKSGIRLQDEGIFPKFERCLDCAQEAIFIMVIVVNVNYIISMFQDWQC